MAEITEAKIYEALGLEQPNDGANGQEVADPAEEASAIDTATGANGQEVADPAPADTETLPDEGLEEAPNEDPAQDKQTMTPQQRRENAARRRQQEEKQRIDQAVSAAVAAEQQRSADMLKGLFAKAGLKNTFTGQPITTMDEFDSYQQQFAAAKLQQDLKAGTLTPEVLDQVISQHPTVKKAAEVLRTSEEAQKKQEEATARANIDAEVAKIHAMDPSITSVNDLLNMPNAKAFYEYARKGLPLSDAYYLVNREKLEAAKAEAIRQQALNNNRGKEHLHSTGNARGSGAVSVTAEQMAMFRLFNPNASEAEILNYYNKHLKK